MSFIQNLYTSRDNNANAATYVGQQDRMWWNPDVNAIYVNTANTPGGTPVGLASSANISINNITANSGTINGNLVIIGNISAASDTKIGGVRAGPGANISDTGLLTINTAGLSFSFGNFYATNNILSIVNADENMILSTDGQAEIQLIGNVGFYKPDGLPPDTANRFAFFNDDGQVTFYVPTVDVSGAVSIIGSSTGEVVAPGLTGSMLHVTGQIDTDCRMYYDGNGGYVAHNSRAWNGNISTGIQAIQAGDDVMRFNATAATSSGMGNVAFAQMRYTAIENQTPTAQGSNINFWTTAAGTEASTRVEVANISVANGVSATKFTTAGTITATGNITGGNLTTVGITSTGSLTASTTINASGNITGGNVAATNYTGLVTHSIRDAGAVGGTTLTLNVTTDDIVHCTFDTNFTVAFSSIIPGRVVTLIATNSSAGDTDIITAGISSVNMQGDNTLTVTQQTTSVVTYYSTGTTTGAIFASAVYG